MRFMRKGRGKFRSEEFTIVRPSGVRVNRDALALENPRHDFNFRLDDEHLWLFDGEREVGYAQGEGPRWQLIVGGRELAANQAKLGVNHFAITEDGELVTEVGGAGFPLKVVDINRSAGLTEEQQAFVVAIALLGWRESDRAMMSRGGRASA